MCLRNVSGHAKLNVPTPWNANPSTTAPCGGPTLVTTPSAVFAAGSTQDLTWQVIAGDGEGPVKVTVDTAGVSSNFAAGTASTLVPLTVGGQTPNALGTFDITITLPSPLTCTGTGGICVAQIKGQNNPWSACFSFVTSAPSTGTGAAIGQPSCVIASGLTFCTPVNGKSVIVPYAMDMLDMDTNAANTYAATRVNTKVFSAGQSAACGAAYQHYLCGSTFGPCGLGYPPNPCHDVCSQVTCYCGLNATHAGLYDCSVATNYGSDRYGSCNTVYGTGPCAAGTSGGPGTGAAAHIVPSFGALISLLLFSAVLLASRR